MAQMDVEVLSSIVEDYLGERSIRLSPAERSELMRLAQALPCKHAASAAGVAYETTRARRKRIYRKCGVNGAGELISALLRVSLGRLGRQAAFSARPAGDDAAATAATAAMSLPRLFS